MKMKDKEIQQDREIQKENLDNIFQKIAYIPVFRRNPKYCVGKFAESVPYIALYDVIDRSYIIRARASDEPRDLFDSEKREIIVQYDCMDELINDGWRLD
jgi:hypothetical protein